MKINYDKSQILFLGEVVVKGVIVERILRCNRGEFPMKYVGVALRLTRLMKEDWT